MKIIIIIINMYADWMLGLVLSSQNSAGVSQENSAAESPKQWKWMVTSFQT